jgi:tetratricopeptide (TPR) repeat protein
MRRLLFISLLFIRLVILSQTDPKVRAQEYYAQACSSLVKKDFGKAIENGRLCLNVSRKIHYLEGEVNGLNVMGVGYARRWEHSKALLYFDSASKYTSVDKRIIMHVHGNFSLQLDSLKQYKKAIENLLAAVKLAEAVGDYQYQEMLYRALAGSYYGLNDLANPKNNKNKDKWADAMFYMEKCTDLLKKHKELKDSYLDYTY